MAKVAPEPFATSSEQEALLIEGILTLTLKAADETRVRSSHATTHPWAPASRITDNALQIRHWSNMALVLA